MFKIIDWASIILLIIGGINLGVVGLINYDMIVHIFSDTLLIAHLIFCLIGAAAFYVLSRFMSKLYKIKPPL